MKSNQPWEDPFNKAILFSPSLAPSAVRKRLLIYKKFSQFYFFRFQPITHEEHNQRTQYHRIYRFSTTAGPILILIFLFVFRHHRDQFHAVHQFKRPHLINSLLVDAVGSLIIGYSAFSLLTYKYIFDRTGLVREKLACEREIAFERREFYLKNQLVKQEEYPLKKQLKQNPRSRGLWKEIKPEEEARLIKKYEEMIKKKQ